MRQSAILILQLFSVHPSQLNVIMCGTIRVATNIVSLFSSTHAVFESVFHNMECTATQRQNTYIQHYAAIFEAPYA